MGEEFQGGVCGGNWWNSSRDLFRSSPCSMAINGAGSFGWPNHDHSITDMKSTKSSNDSTGSASDVWNQDLLHDNVRSDETYSNIMQEVTGLNSSMNFHNSPQISNNFCEDLSSINSFKQVNQSFHLDQQPNFPLNSDSYSLLQTLFETDSQTEQSLLDNQAMNYSIDSNGFLPDFTKSTPMVKPSFTNTTPFWNATAAPLSDVCSSFIPSTQSQFIPSTLNNKKPNPTSFNSKRRNEEARDLASVAKKNSNEPTFKRPRIETPSPLPTFKVRKEKLGDRITALQQLVSPFGKTDTASVLHEAIDYIKFLHDQLSVLSTPYLKNGSPQLQHQQVDDKFNGQDLQKPDLRSRGLCLVPISSTFPVAAETTSDFWTPTFGGTFR